MSKLSAIFGKKDDQDASAEAQPEASETAEAQPEASETTGAQPEGDAEHPPAAMPEDASVAAVPADAPETFSSIEEYEQTLNVPDTGIPAPQSQDATQDS
jgi:hypothetical protein